jgi:RND family efflux transporter MFP subunit
MGALLQVGSGEGRLAIRRRQLALPEDQAQANLRSAEAQVSLAQLNLSYTDVRAPFDGRMDRRLRDPGNLVGAGENTVLASINQIDPMYLYFNIADVDLARLLKSSHGIPGVAAPQKWPVFAGLPSEEGYPHRGYLDFAAISLTTTTGTLLMRGILPNANGQILAGLFARVRVPIEQRTALVVPEVAIGHDQQGSYVFVVNEKNVVERRSVKTGPTVDSLRAIDEGLKGTEWVIVKGLVKAAPDGRSLLNRREARARGARRVSVASGAEGEAVISEFFIDRPIFANVIAFIIVIIGGVAFYRLPVAQYPEIVPPTVQVTTRYPGASAEVVAATIGVPLEQAINGVEGAIYMSSTSASDGSYTLTVTFDVGTDINTSLTLVQNAASSALSQLPAGSQAQGVTVKKVSPNILLVASLYSDDDRFDEIFLSNYAIINLQNPLAGFSVSAR